MLLLAATLMAGSVRGSIAAARNAVAEQLQAAAAVIAARSSASNGGGAGAAAAAGAGSNKPPSQPGFWRTCQLVLARAVLIRTREPVLVFIEYLIYACTGMFVGLMSDRGRGSIGSLVGNLVYSVIAMGMLATVSGCRALLAAAACAVSPGQPGGPPTAARLVRWSATTAGCHGRACACACACACLHMYACVCPQISGIKTYGGPDRLVYYREASAGLHKLAYFWALDTWSHVGARWAHGGMTCGCSSIKVGRTVAAQHHGCPSSAPG
jgi:hypothetical protein